MCTVLRHVGDGRGPLEPLVQLPPGQCAESDGVMHECDVFPAGPMVSIEAVADGTVTTLEVH